MINISYYNDNDGVENEKNFVNYINGKKVKELNIMFQSFIYDLYDNNINCNQKIYCWKNPNKYKTDIYIRKDNSNISKKISIKKGIKNSVHVEPISCFVNFLIRNDVPRDIIIKYLRFHYADGTINGTGKNRMSVNQYKELFQSEIDEINAYLNNEMILKNAITRFLINGNNSREYIDAIIYGIIDDFIWIKRNDIYNIVLSKKEMYSSTVHFGPLFCQPQDRCLNYNNLYEKKRYVIQVKWYNLGDDIIENMNNKITQSYVD